MCSEVERWLRDKEGKEVVNDEFLRSVKLFRFRNAGWLVKEMIDAYGKTGLCNQKLHFVDHAEKGLDRFGSLELLSVSAFDRFKINIRRANQCMLQQLGRALGETLRGVKAIIQDERERLVALRKEKQRRAVE